MQEAAMDVVQEKEPIEASIIFTEVVPLVQALNANVWIDRIREKWKENKKEKAQEMKQKKKTIMWYLDM